MRWLAVAANQDASHRSAAARMWDCDRHEHASAEVLTVSRCQNDADAAFI